MNQSLVVVALLAACGSPEDAASTARTSGEVATLSQVTASADLALRPDVLRPTYDGVTTGEASFQYTPAYGAPTSFEGVRRGDGLTPLTLDADGTATIGHPDAPLGYVDERGLSFSTGGEVTLTAWGRGDAMVAPRTAPLRLDEAGRAVQDLGGLRGWWASRDQRIEQGWTVDVRPAGAGPLRLHLDTPPATVDDAGAWADLDTPGGPWLMAGLAAWDASGAPLDVRVVSAAGGVELVVDDRGAAYPLTIDPAFMVETDQLTLAGTQSSFGLTVVHLGDFNLDGWDDVGVSDQNGAHVYVFTSGPSGIVGSPILSLTGDPQFGSGLDGGGDLDNDGVPDLVATSPGGDLIAICYGAAAPVCSTLHVNNTTNYGHSVTTNGDFNADGYSDVWFGLETASGDYRAQVCLGTATRGILNCTGSIDADLPTDPIRWLGDVNGDGVDDIAVGRLLGDGADIIFPNGSGSFSLLQITEAAFGFPQTDLGLAVAAPRDINNDGYADYMIGGGYALLLYGTPTGIPVNYVSRDSSLGSHGRGVSAGDFDGDGDKDLVWVGSGFGEIFDATPTGFTRTQVLTYPGTRWGDGGVTAPFDLGDDGDLDVVVGTFNGYVSVLSPAVDDDGDGYIAGVDCNDSVASINPGAAEGTGDEVDQNCDGAERCFADVDRDGSRDSLATTPSSDLDCRDPGEARTSAPLDCDDSSDDYEVTCPPLRLTVSSPAVAGQPATIAVEGAPIGGRVYIVRGSTTGTTAFGCVTVNLRNVSVITNRAADASGRVSITPTLPAALSGTTQNLQAAVPSACDVSNRVTFSVQ